MYNMLTNALTLRHKAETDYNTLYVAILLGVGLMVVLVVGVALRQRKDYHTHDGFIQASIAFAYG
jgi:hypothetical protein